MFSSLWIHKVLPNHPLSVLPAETNVKNFSHKDLRGFVRMGGPLFKICSLFFVMCQKVKRRLVVRSNDDRRLLLRFLASVAVTEISKPIIEVLSFCDRERAQPLLIKRILLTFWWKNKKQNKTKKTVKLSGMNSFFENTQTNYKFDLVLVLKFKGFNSA